MDFLLGPKLTPWAPPSQDTSGPNLQPLTVAQSVAQSIKKKIVFMKKKNHNSAAQTTNPNESQINSTITIQISNSQKPNTFEIKLFTETKYI